MKDERKGSTLSSQVAVDFSKPTAEDGHAVNRLIAECSPLDTNSVYCNLLQCSHFSQTSICAKNDGLLAGFTSGYLLPASPNTLFIWQVAVSSSFRGQGLATQMLHKLLRYPNCQNVEYLETTITDSNDASWSLFLNLARHLSATTETSEMFENENHFKGQHETEKSLRIGPFTKRFKPQRLL